MSNHESINTTLIANGTENAAPLDLSLGYLPPQTVAARENEFIPWRNLVVNEVCGDEREVVDCDRGPSMPRLDLAVINSDAALQEFLAGNTATRRAALSPHLGGLSVYANHAGLGKSILVTGIATHSEGSDFPDIFMDYGDNPISGIVNLLGERSVRTSNREFGLRPAFHSAIDQEQAAYATALRQGLRDPSERPSAFCLHGDADTGCAACSNLAKAADLVGTNATVQEIASHNVAHIFDEPSDSNNLFMQSLPDANNILVSKLGGPDFQFSRQMVVKSPGDLITLQGGPHANPATSGLLINRNPYEISRTGTGMYHADIAAATANAQRLLPELKLPARHLIEALVADSVAIRHLLTGGDANSLRVGIRGPSGKDMLAQIAHIANI